MAKLNIGFPEADYALLENGQIDIIDFLNKLLPISAEQVLNPENELVNLLLSYHSDDGGAVKLTRIMLDGVIYNPIEKTGKIDFKYHLAYHYACSYADKDYVKNDKTDFVIDREAGLVILTFLDLSTRSTAEEF